MTARSLPWYREWFNESYLRVYSHRNEELAEIEVEFIINHLDLKEENRILDLCCGAGRHLQRFIEKGFKRVVGFDLSESLLNAAENRTDHGLNLVRGDMRQLPFSERFDAVVSLFTSFGYFDSDEKNRDVLREIRIALAPEGRFLLDLPSVGVTENLVSETERTVDGLHVHETRHYEEETRRIRKEITIHGPEGSQEYSESVRVYSLGELKVMLANAGLCLLQMSGDFQGGPFHPHSERMIAIGTRCDAPAILRG